MSLLRQRATVWRVESTLSAFSPALALARLVIATRSDSDVELNDPLLQARVATGTASVKTDVSRNRMPIASSRAARTGRSWGGWEPTCDLRLRTTRAGVNRVSGHGRLGSAGCPLGDGPGAETPWYRRVWTCPVRSRRVGGSSGAVGPGAGCWGAVGTGPGGAERRRTPTRGRTPPTGWPAILPSLVPPRGAGSPRTSTAVALAQWQSIGLWLRRLRVRAP